MKCLNFNGNGVIVIIVVILIAGPLPTLRAMLPIFL